MQTLERLTLTYTKEEAELLTKIAHEQGTFRNKVLRDGLALVHMFREMNKNGEKVWIESADGTKRELKLL